MRSEPAPPPPPKQGLLASPPTPAPPTPLKTLLIALLPSPLHPRLSPHPTPRPHPTAYLDGLRGLASLSVVLLHYTSNFAPRLNAAYSAPSLKMVSSPLQLPFIRVLYAGRPFVHVFFVISGLVLSLKPLRLARAGDYAGVQGALAGSVFRRGWRLYLPCVGSTVVSAWMMHYHWGFPPFVEGGWAAEARHVAGELWVFGNQVWGWDRRRNPLYDGHMWTIPIEMCMSMVLFVTVLGLSRCRGWVRMGMIVGIIWYTVLAKFWAPAEFLGGALIAEFGLIQEEYNGANAKALDAAADVEKRGGDRFEIILPSSTRRVIGKVWRLFWWCQLIIALYICSWPYGDLDHVPILKWLQERAPDNPCPDTFWFVPTAFLLVGACHQLVTLQKLLTTPFVQYLASISYALYLMHGPVMHAVEFTMQPVFRLNGGIDGAGFWGYHFQWFVGLWLIGVPIWWAADLFWRFVDQPCVEFARWFDRKCIDKQE